MFLFISSLIAGFFPTAFAGDTNRFHIICQEADSSHLGQIGLSNDEEIALLNDALNKSYLSFSSDIQKISLQVTYVINRNSDFTWAGEGWSAEDDPEYRFPDQTFYPKGTIKVNFGQKFISTLQLLHEKEFLDSPEVIAAEPQYMQMVIYHETIHASQYHTHPVQSLDTTPGSVVDGLADPQVLSATREKLAYEHEAFEQGRKALTAKSVEVLKVALDKYSALHPDQFLENGKYKHLKPSGIAKTLLTELSLQGTNNFNPGAHTLLDGQVILPQAVLDLKVLNDQLQKMGKLRANDALTAKKKLILIHASYDEIISAPNAKKLTLIFPYMTSVEKRFDKELERFAQLTSRSGMNN